MKTWPLQAVGRAEELALISTEVKHMLLGGGRWAEKSGPILCGRPSDSSVFRKGWLGMCGSSACESSAGRNVLGSDDRIQWPIVAKNGI